MHLIAMTDFTSSDSSSLGLGILLFYIITFLLITVPTVLILYLVYKSFYKPTLSTYNATSLIKSLLPPLVILALGIVTAYINAVGQNIYSKPIGTDTALLLSPFVLGSFATFNVFSKKLRYVFIVLAGITALIFVLYHYPHIFFGKQ